jgi:mono/diheme cytochrome c family protein
MSTLRTVLVTTAAWLAIVVVVAAGVVISGIYPVAATREHVQLVHDGLAFAMRRSVQFWARDVQVPVRHEAVVARRGAACFAAHCVQCHGAPGVAPSSIGRGMQPLPGPLVDAAHRWRTRELYWITKHGIRMSGMPAWEFRLPERDLWAVVGFLERLPHMGPADYAAAIDRSTPLEPRASHDASDEVACGFTPRQRDAVPQRPPDLERGRLALSQYACSACHTIPGVTHPSPQVGPPLTGLASRSLIAGTLANTPGNMVHWLRRPHAVDPQTAMPDLQVTESDARDMAAYLATLR